MAQAKTGDSVPLDDRGLLLGDGVFETLLWDQGQLLMAGAHAARMIRGAQMLGLPAPDEAAFVACALSAVSRGGYAGGPAAVRVTFTAGSGGRGLERPATVLPRLFARASAYLAPAGPAALALASIRRNEASPLSRIKSLAYLDNVLARREAAGSGADEAVLLNTRGELACAAVANLFWVESGTLFTPPVEAGCLEGVTRALVLSLAPALGVVVQLVRAPPEAIERADAVFLTNSLMGVRPAASFAGRRFEPSPLVARIAEAVASRRRG